MMSNFDSISDFVIPEYIFEGVREVAKENATSSINVEFSWTFSWWAAVCALKDVLKRSVELNN
jgi:hypothetical protein